MTSLIQELITLVDEFRDDIYNPTPWTVKNMEPTFREDEEQEND